MSNDELYASATEQDLIQRYISEGDIVFDIGAFKGLWTDKALAKLPKQIHLFEPLVSEFQNLQQKYNHLICEEKVFVTNCAIFDSVGTQEFHHYQNYPTLSTIFRRINAEKNEGIEAPNPPILISTTTIEQYCKEHEIEHIHYMKTDVEGAELKVMQGAENLLSQHMIDYIEFEYGGTYLDSNTTLESIYNIFVSKGYNVFKTVSNGYMHIPIFRTELENYEYSNFIAVSPNCNI